MDSVRASGGTRPLEGLEIALAGGLATMSLDEAYERIIAAGGRWVARPGPRTAWLVVGSRSLPLGEDGDVAEPLAEARRRADAGEPLEIVPEDEFLARLGLAGHGAELQRLYTAAQLARIVGIAPRQLRTWIRAGLVRPVKAANRLSFFGFRQLAVARTLAQLSAQGVGTRRIRNSLAELARWWPGAAAALTGLTADEQPGELLVRTTDGGLAEPSGQLRLDFATTAAPQDDVPTTGEAWFQRALRLEEDERMDEAVQAYARALDPAHPRAEVAFNLGNALYGLDRPEEAATALTLATEVDPEYTEAWNNLGNALSALGRHEDACRAFERALALEPAYADAHFNLGETLAALGDVTSARRHWRAYLAFDPSSSWAAEVRARLRRTDPRAAAAGPGPTLVPHRPAEDIRESPEPR